MSPLSWKFGFEKVIRAMSAKVLASGKSWRALPWSKTNFIKSLRCAPHPPRHRGHGRSLYESARLWVARIPCPSSTF